MTPVPDTSLNAARRARDLTELASADAVDLLVVGGGATGAGVALDAAARGLSVVLAERHDLAWGTSRWSSKLVHGGLRYLAHGDVALAYESARERGLLMRRIAPHLVAAMPQVFPALPGRGRAARLTRTGLMAGDLLRAAARTPRRVLPRPRWLNPADAYWHAPTLGDIGGGMLGHDGQLTDDAALVVALARTAAGHGARILTRCAVSALTGDGGTLTDTLTGQSLRLRARAVINATGVWAGDLVPGLALTPSRGTHLVLRDEDFGGLRGGVFVPSPDSDTRYVFALPAEYGRVYVGITDEPAPGPVPDVPEPPEAEITWLLDAIGTALRAPLARSQVVGVFAGLRPLAAGGAGATADLSRRHSVTLSLDGVVTVVGGKLTTYRRMAEDAVDAAVRAARLPAAPCRTATLPLVGAASPYALAVLVAPARLVRRYGTEATRILADGSDAPVADGLPLTRAELEFGMRHEGALDAADLLDRRTRIGLVPADRTQALTVAEEIAAGIPG
ncbi:MAG: FAD-dependent oxidoreductase [Streptosporangiales bacterium]|nr:FAD-dependent oxidoreductase [Streptosporangiales bacterium]